MEPREKTLGEQRVRTSFNPSATGTVDRIKNLGAKLIDLTDSLEASDGEQQRLKSLAMTEFESGVHWAVKAATYGL